MMLECWKRAKIGWEVQKCKKLKFDSIFLTGESPVDKENSIWERKVQNQMFMDSIKSYLRFNWIYGVFDCKKNWFLSQFQLLLDEIKVLGSNYNFKKLIWSNQGLNCIIIEVWERKVQNQMFMDSIKSYLRFNWIYEVFDCKKNWFLSQFQLLLDEIKVLGSNYNFKKLIWSNQGLNCIIIEVW